MSTGRPADPTQRDLAPSARSAETRLLVTLAAVLARVDAVDAALERLLELAAELLDGAVVALAIQEPDSGVLVAGPARGFDGARLLDEPLVVAASDDALAVAAREGVAIAIPTEHVSPSATRHGIGAAVVLPLVVHRDSAELTVGVMLVAHTDGRALSDDEVRLADAIAAIAAAVVERGFLTATAQARADWRERLAQVDPLTGLANRRAFEHVAEMEVARAIRQSTALSVVVIDVDELAALREAAGRRTADDVLRRVAVAIADGVRLVDTVARLGASEFVVLAPGSGGDAVARRIADAVSGLEPVAGRKVHVSTGVAHVPADGATLDSLIDAATGWIERSRSTAG